MSESRSLLMEPTAPGLPTRRLTGAQFFTEGVMEAACERYRSGHMHEQLQLQDVCATLSSLTAPQPLPLQGNVAVFNRLGFEGRAAQAAEAARAYGQALVYSTDDLLFADEMARQTTYHRNFRQSESDVSAYDGTDFWQRCQRLVENQRGMLMFCDCAVVTTEYLAERVREMGKPAYVIRNAMSREMAALSQKVRRTRDLAGGRIALGYLSGSATHSYDFAEIAPVLASLMRKHWNVYLIVVGPMHLPDCLEEFGPRVRRHPYVDWRALPGLIGDLDINLAPLDMLVPFTHAKSEIKWMEAGAVGVPTVASATSGFREAVRHGETGLLVNTPQEWGKALEDLVTQPELRARLGEAARREVFAHYTADARSREALDVFAEIAECYAASPAGQAPPVIPAPPEPGTAQRAAWRVRRAAALTARNWRRLADPRFWSRVLSRWERGERDA
ncbi:MAG: glycosyltransferase family 4 protein [Armatimonadetes bacterium]|nr:glycosyltransferase family 4 protein [Armatimonadota bacterium]